MNFSHGELLKHRSRGNRTIKKFVYVLKINRRIRPSANGRRGEFNFNRVSWTDSYLKHVRKRFSVDFSNTQLRINSINQKLIYIIYNKIFQKIREAYKKSFKISVKMLKKKNRANWWTLEQPSAPKMFYGQFGAGFIKRL